MKYSAKFPLGVMGFWILVMGCTFLSLVTGFASPNPYSGIVDRNSFGLRPPTPEAKPEPPPPAASKIRLQGLTTILGRKQVLLKTTVPARPPEFPSPRELSMVLSEGQRDGEVEVIEINPVAGTVKFKNGGKIESLNMKDDTDKPAPTAPISTGGAGVSLAPHVSERGTSVAPAQGIDPFGSTKAIPPRTPRTTGDAALKEGLSGVVPLTTQQKIAAERTPEETMALQLLNQTKNDQLIQSGVKMPRIRFPITETLKQSGNN